MARKRTGIMVAILLFLGAVAYLGLKFYMESNARNLIQQWANQTEWITDLSCRSLEVGLFSKVVQARQISLQIRGADSPVAIERLILHAFDGKNEIPTFMHVEMQGIHISGSNTLFKGIAPVLTQLGCAVVDADVEYAYRYDPMNKKLEIQQIRATLSEMGRFEMAAMMNNLDLAVIKMRPSNALSLIALVPAVAISKIVFDYQDHSMMRRFIQMGARQSGQSIEQFTDDIIQRMNLEIQKHEKSATGDNFLAVQHFIKNPGQIRIVISPHNPVPLIQLAMVDNIGQIVDLLKITVTYQEVK